eukprot:Skav207283  [mRNA]  locus=scaffold434:170306:173651:+ [translate_table: standard]
MDGAASPQGLCGKGGTMPGRLGAGILSEVRDLVAGLTLREIGSALYPKISTFCSFTASCGELNGSAAMPLWNFAFSTAFAASTAARVA